MASFVLVHGGAHGAWCWERLVPHVEADPRSEAVVAVDLSGHGARRESKPLDQIRIADYVDDIVAEIEARDLQDVILVGHSLAGISVGHAAARVLPRMRHLIYLSTTNPASGQSVNDCMKHPLSPISRGADMEAMFTNDLDEETSAWLLANLGPEPPGPMAEPITLAALPASLPQTYILLTKDEALPPDYQREQAAVIGVDDIVPFDSGHSAFAARPRELAALLLRYAGQGAEW